MSQGEKFPVTRSEVDFLKSSVEYLESQVRTLQSSFDGLRNGFSEVATQSAEARGIAIQASHKVPLLESQSAADKSQNANAVI